MRHIRWRRWKGRVVSVNSHRLQFHHQDPRAFPFPSRLTWPLPRCRVGPRGGAKNAASKCVYARQRYRVMYAFTMSVRTGDFCGCRGIYYISRFIVLLRRLQPLSALRVVLVLYLYHEQTIYKTFEKSTRRCQRNFLISVIYQIYEMLLGVQKSVRFFKFKSNVFERWRR